MTPADVNRGQEPSKRLAEPVDLDATRHRVIQAGDVLIPSVMTKGRTCRVRVATDTDDGSLLALRSTWYARTLPTSTHGFWPVFWPMRTTCAGPDRVR